MYVTPEGCNADATLHKDISSYTDSMNINSAHLSNQASVTIWSPVNQAFCRFDLLTRPCRFTSDKLTLHIGKVSGPFARLWSEK
jgi:hypothetical protein